jgi:hypothetical protein
MGACMFSRMPARRARPYLALRLLLIALVTVAVVVLAGVSVALELAPAALLALPLLFGRYPGERVIHRLTRPVVPARAIRSAVLPRAPRLLGARIAVLAVPGSGRAPPAAVLI